MEDAAQQCSEEEGTTSYSNDEFIAGLQMSTPQLHTTVDEHGNQVLLTNDVQYFSENNRITIPLSSSASGKPSLHKPSEKSKKQKVTSESHFEPFGTVTQEVNPLSSQVHDDSVHHMMIAEQETGGGSDYIDHCHKQVQALSKSVSGSQRAGNRVHGTDLSSDI